MLGRQAAGHDHSSQAARRVRAAAEPEEKDLIAVLVQMRDAGVTLLDLVVETLTEGAAQKVNHGVSVRSDTVVVNRDTARR